MWKRFFRNSGSDSLQLEGYENAGPQCTCCEILENVRIDWEPIREIDVEVEYREIYETYEIVLKLVEAVMILICFSLAMALNEKKFFFQTTYYFLTVTPTLFLALTSFLLLLLFKKLYYSDNMTVVFSSLASVLTGACSGVSFDVWVHNSKSEPILLVYSIFSLVAASIHLLDVFLKARSMSGLKV